MQHPCNACSWYNRLTMPYWKHVWQKSQLPTTTSFLKASHPIPSERTGAGKAHLQFKEMMHHDSSNRWPTSKYYCTALKVLMVPCCKEHPQWLDTATWNLPCLMMLMIGSSPSQVMMQLCHRRIAVSQVASLCSCHDCSEVFVTTSKNEMKQNLNQPKNKGPWTSKAKTWSESVHWKLGQQGKPWEQGTSEGQER